MKSGWRWKSECRQTETFVDNKLYTYPLTGCYTLASKTAAQVQFMEEFPTAGELIDLNDPEFMANALKELHENRSVLLEKESKPGNLPEQN